MSCIITIITKLHTYYIKFKKGTYEMIKGIGIDIIELSRIKKSIHKNSRLVERILTENEQSAYYRLPQESRRIEFLAGRFAAKEAFAKATGRGIGKLSFQHIEILSKQSGAPQLTAKGYESEKIFISISHSKQYAIAQVIIAEQ